MPYRFVNFLDNIEKVIPSNYIHTFLIRNPQRTMPSFLKLVKEEGIKDAAFAGMYSHSTSKMESFRSRIKRKTKICAEIFH